MNNNSYDNDTSFSEESSVLLLYGAWLSSRDKFYALIATIGVLFVMGIISNVLVCVVMVRTGRIRKNLSNVFIFNLSLLEVSFRVVIFPLYVLVKLPLTLGFSTPAVCKLTSFLYSAWGTAVFCSTVVIALDRYNNIVSPLKSRKRKQNPFSILTLLWLYAVMFSLPVLLSASDGVKVTELPEVDDNLVKFLGSNAVVCDLSRDWSGQFSTTVYFLFSFLIPILIISSAYIRIVICLSKRGRLQPANRNAAKSKVKAVRMLVLMVVGFVVSWGPTTILSMLRLFYVLDQKPYVVVFVVTMLAEVLMFSSSVINPVLYAYYNRDFRKQLALTCCKCKCGAPEVSLMLFGKSPSEKILTTKATRVGPGSSGSLSPTANRRTCSTKL